jgi:hypothetical protein
MAGADSDECGRASGGKCRQAGLGHITLDSGAGVEEHALTTEPLVQTGIAYDLEDGWVQTHDPDHRAAPGRRLLVLHQDLQRGVLDVGCSAHVEHQHARLMFRD